jgi:hypothetical protein
MAPLWGFAGVSLSSVERITEEVVVVEVAEPAERAT